MTRPPDLSIVICTYNRAASLQLTLAALAAQVTRASIRWEVVIVDNNSTDATHAVIQRFVSTADIPSRYVFVAEQGLSRARNAGVAASRGDIIAFTDDDVLPAADWVDRIAITMAETNAHVVGGRIVPTWLEEPPAWLRHRSALHGALAILDYANAMPVLDAHRAPSVWGANMAFRRCVFERVGGFDTRRGLVGATLHRGEEIDLVARALAAGCQAVYEPSIIVSHRIGPERMRMAYLSRLYFQRAEGDALVQPRVDPVEVRALPACRVAVAIAGWLWAAVRRRPDTIERWFACCAALGALWGTRRSPPRAGS
jgi:glycosyltransferase involved in cell wall biosynthesis